MRTLWRVRPVVKTSALLIGAAVLIGCLANLKSIMCDGLTSRTARMGDYLMRILQSWTTITNQSLAMDSIGCGRRAGPSLPALHPG
jgi:hypothetical protein